MTHNHKKGMKLTNAENLQTTAYDWLLNTVMTFVAFTVLVVTLTMISGMGEICSLWIIIIPGAVLCVVEGMLAKLNQHTWFYPGVLVAQILLILSFWKQLTKGIAVVWNQIGCTYTANTGWAVPELAVTDVDSEITAALMIIGLILALVCSVVCRYAPMAMSVILPATTLLGVCLMHWNPSIFSLAPALLAGMLLLAYGSRGKRPVKAVLLSWCIILLLSAVCFPVSIMEPMQEKGVLVKEQVHEKIHNLKYETEQTTLPEGDFSQFEAEQEDKEKEYQPALVVKTDTPEVMYLRGFTGAVFEENQWLPMDTEILAENRDLLYGLQLYAFQPDHQFEAAFGSTGKTETHSITVENKGACSKYQYVPFSLCAGDVLQAENLNTDGLYADGERSYTYNVVTGSIDAIEKTVKQLQTSKADDALEYRRAESVYRTIVYDHYLQIPQDVREMMEPSWEIVAERYEKNKELTFQQRQECVQTFLELCFSSSEDLEVSLPLQIAEGTSFQEATVSAMTLRYFGIPSRYAEGYIISEKMAFETKPGTPMQVDSSCAGAWVEVYQDGIGWVPMEFVLGIDEKQQNSSGEDEDSDITEGVEIEKIPKDDFNPPEPKGGSRVKVIQRMAWGLLKYAGLLLLAAVILWIRRYLILKKKEQKYQDCHINAAIGWIFADTAKLLTQMGFDRGNGSMKNLYGAVREHFDAEYATMFEDTERLNARALFSGHPMSEEDRQCALQFGAMTKQQMKKNVTWYKRIWLKWIKCLY